MSVSEHGDAFGQFNDLKAACGRGVSCWLVQEKMMWDLAKWLVATKRVDMQALNKKLKTVLTKILLKASEHKQDGRFPDLDKCQGCLAAQGGLTLESVIDVFFAFIKWPQSQGVVQDYDTFEKICAGNSG